MSLKPPVGTGGSSTEIGSLQFDLQIPTRIVFGRGSRAGIGQAAAELGRRACVITSRTFGRTPESEVIIGSLAAAGVDVAARVVAHGEPDTTAVMEATAAVMGAQADIVVAIGGGSAIDLAKASALRPSAERLTAYLAGERVDRQIGLPVIALPTTTGSGAEVTHAAIILDREAVRKRGVRGPGVAARVAIVDPDLVDDLPAPATASSAFDAMAHAIETAVSRAATPHVIAWSGLAIGLLLEAIPRSLGPSVNPADRDAAAYAALLMGLNLAASTTCLPHRLQYPLGARTGSGHAEGVAALMPAWLERTVAIAPDRLARVAVASGLAAADEPSGQAAAVFRERVERFIDSTGMRRRLGDLGIAATDIDGLVAAVEGTLANDPGPIQPSDLRALYLASV